jgi:hypothetical protein
VPPKAGQFEPVGRTLGEDFSGSFARARGKPGNDRDALIHASCGARGSGQPSKESSHDLPEQAPRRALAVIEGGGHGIGSGKYVAEDENCVDGIEAADDERGDRCRDAPDDG